MADFIEPALGEHGFGALMNAGVEKFARRIEADADGAPTGEWSAARSIKMGERNFGEETDFDGADEFLLIGRRDALCGGGIETSEDAVEMMGRMAGGGEAEAFAKLLGTDGDVGEAFE